MYTSQSAFASLHAIPHTIAQTTTQPTPGSQPPATSPNPHVNLGLPVTMGMLALMSWSVILACKRYAKEEQNGELPALSNSVPCYNCRYYSNNAYLKCPVNPSMVLTEQAKDCSDYHVTSLSDKVHWLSRRR